MLASAIVTELVIGLTSVLVIAVAWILVQQGNIRERISRLEEWVRVKEKK